MTHSYRISPHAGIQNNVYAQESPKTALNESLSPDRRRRNSGQAPRSPSILSGLRSLMLRPRSESLNSQMMHRPIRPLMKVQVSNCHLESVYDLRENNAEGETDFYDDEMAFRRPRSNSSDFLILRKTSRPLSVDVVGLVDSQSDPYRQYMKVVDCYELAPATGNIIVLDKNMTIEKAFEALCQHNVGSGLVWDCAQNKVTSIVTLTDFFHLLHAEGVSSASPHQKLSSLVIEKKLVSVSAEAKILEACEEFCMNRVHRIVVRDPASGDILYLLTIKRILQAIHKQNRSLHFAQWLSCPIENSEVGTWKQNIHTVKKSDTVAAAVTSILESRVSSMPVLDADGRPVDVFCKADVATALWHTPLEQHATLLSSPISSILSSRPARPFLQSSDSVAKVLDALLCSRHVRAVFVLDSESSLIACVSQSDVISHMIHNESPFQQKKDVKCE